jgi:hypothetical protein
MVIKSVNSRLRRFNSKRSPALFLMVALPLTAPSASGQTANGPDNGRKQAHAVRVANESVAVDGRLDEAVWRTAPTLGGFVQKEPVEGAPATDPMEVRFAYDDSALYIGARLSSTSDLQAPVGRRDEGEQSEHLLVSLDTYLDRRTASTFGVTASGVRLDSYHPTDDDDGDDDFDPVWQARAAMDENGWTAELWIPFSQLRFNDRSPQVWGLNVRRWVPSRNEEVFWVLVPRTEQGWASHFGDLNGIDGIRPSRRLELLPYVASSSQLIGNRDPGDPFNGGANLEGRVGMDLKMGLGPNLTLEATVNPDFGQVEADPAEVNLSAFETFFEERRPFFIEGSGLLVGNVNNYFYSRRIGAPPAGRAPGDFVDNPATSTILGAAKLTGRLSSGTSVAFLGAATSEESARTFAAPAQFGTTRVAPQALYGVARVEQEFGPPGSTFSLMTTTMHRDLPDGDPLGALLTRNAFSLSGDTLLRLKDNEYQVHAYSGISFVEGDPRSLDRTQRASAHFMQRPDADYLRYDPNRTAMSGGKHGIVAERRNGRHWLWEAQFETESPEFDVNDVGRLTAADGMVGNAQLTFRETVPGRWYRNYAVELTTNNEWNYGLDRQNKAIGANARITWPSFWTSEYRSGMDFRRMDSRLTRGGPLMETPGGWNVSLEIESPDAAETRGAVEATYSRNEDGGLGLELESQLSMRPGARWALSIAPSYEREVGTQQYVTTRSDGSAATFGGRYIFAHIDRSTYSTQFRLNYTFKPDLTLDLYAEPFTASGRYSHFGELSAPRTRLLRTYGTDGTTMTVQPDGSRTISDGDRSFTLANRDFNVQSFRSNLVLRWEWRAGSTLYLVWQQDRSEEITASTRATLGDLFGSVGARGDNFLAMKVSFWLAP